MKRPRLDVKKYSGALGAEVFGLDLAQPLGKETLEEVRNAWLEHLVLFFRDQRLTPTQHYAFAQQFGELMEHPYIEGIADYPEIIEIVRTPGQTYNFDRCFHADLTFLDEPAAGAALYARELPPYGGDTMFANMYLAYDTLSDGMKTMLAGLEAGQVQLLQRDESNKVTVSTNEVDLVAWSADEVLRNFLGVGDPTDQRTVKKLKRLRVLQGKQELSTKESEEMESLSDEVSEDLLSGPVAAQVDRFIQALEQAKAGEL